MLMMEFGDLAAEVQNTEPTKQNVIRAASRRYDPLGISAPLIIRLKILSQELCEEKLIWDEPLPQGLQSKWQAQVTSLQYFNNWYPQILFH